jgi:tetratricopeptide (TPR) repeat protein
MSNFDKMKTVNLCLILAMISCQTVTNKQQVLADKKPEAIALNKKAGDIYARNLYNRDSMLYAIKLFDQAIARDSSYPAPVTNKMNVLLNLKEYNQAIATGKNFIAQGQGYAEFYQYLGLIYDKIDKKDSANYYHQKALSLFDQRIQMDSNAINLSNKYISLLTLDTSKREKILVQLDSLIEQNPTNSTLLLTRETVQDFDRDAFINEIIR